MMLAFKILMGTLGFAMMCSLPIMFFM